MTIDCVHRTWGRTDKEHSKPQITIRALNIMVGIHAFTGLFKFNSFEKVSKIVGLHCYWIVFVKFDVVVPYCHGICDYSSS